MADKTLKLEVVTPERKVLSEEITSLIVPAIEGYLGVLPNHAPLISGLEPGVVKYKMAGEYKKMAISGGFLEVVDNKVSLLANTAELPEEIDVTRALAAKERAEERLRNKVGVDIFRAEMALRRAIARLRTIGRDQH
ncbi:MAG: F-type H+-transporting ATPase subunit epsilon [Clostridia bacterium]|jgi:F-type H+-transporting ATPase subunit epsilon|nr:F-type H+-transporting ATPase subunit epsilon [Clostridia bacterium]MDN5323442.1 F-type H+-transporting ATPase subunit epsilon [Clostridia bacterium]